MLDLAKLEISRQILENPQISDFVKILPVADELSHVDGQTSMTKLTAVFRSSANASKRYHRMKFTNNVCTLIVDMSVASIILNSYDIKEATWYRIWH